MHFFCKPKNKPLSDWIRDNHLFVDAYYAAYRDERLKVEIEQLELKYIRHHLIDQVGEDEADRIMSERGF